ncbi:UbiA family prenyltransferase [Bernardetia sp. ABR2-2B]|uniref:UbiA family prenyltransferase n=1 Tax=Bernardetia sp. ABR2-2B TaxID=3127472 RepID=UPI0030D54A6C
MKAFFIFLIQLFLSFRPLNLFLIVLTQTLTSVFLLDNSLCISNLFKNKNFIFCSNFYLLVLATILSAAAGYVLNDIFDRRIDLINSPLRSSFTEKNLYLFYFLSSLFLGIALLLSFIISLKIGFAVLFSCLLLVFYAKKSKQLGILKPVLVSFLTAFSILLVSFINYSISTNYTLILLEIPITIYFFSFWAFLLSMLREIIKDFEDFEGDISQHSFTSTIHLGKHKSKTLLIILSSLLILSLLVAPFFTLNTSFRFLHQLTMIVLVGNFIFLLNDKKFNSSTSNYKKLSLFCKIMMLIGILGMMAY